MRVVVVSAALLCFLAVVASAVAEPSNAAPVLTVSPEVGSGAVARTSHIEGLLPSQEQTLILFDPAGGQSVMHPTTDETGAVSVLLRPDGGQWNDGVYRLVLDGGNGSAVSQVFVVGQPTVQVVEQPELPSPTSAFAFIASGLSPNAAVDLVVSLPALRGTYGVHATSDASGVATAYLWPEQLGLPFWSAGIYTVAVAGTPASSQFMVREHPGSAAIAVDDPIVAGDTGRIRLSRYVPDRYVWAIYADSDGHVQGQAVLGPTDLQGNEIATVPFSSALLPGRHLVATPYEWGEASFDVIAPTPTITDTPTVTPIPTDTATPTSIPTPMIPLVTTYHIHKHCTRNSEGKRHCSWPPDIGLR